MYHRALVGEGEKIPKLVEEEEDWEWTYSIDPTFYSTQRTPSSENRDGK